VQYISTRGSAPPVDFEGVLLKGLAPDGGLYLPEQFPALPPDWPSWDYRDSMTAVLGLFGAGDVGPLVGDAAGRFREPEVAPIREVDDRLVLELFWGPTLSFKDHALQVVARLIDRALAGRSEKATILVATSGDTGSAAIEACRGRSNVDVLVLFPNGMVSDFQRRQMTTVSDANVRAVAVKGTFDDCQRLVKSALAEPGLTGLLTANSINWARVAAQTAYHVYAAARVGAVFDVVVPTGNFGNVYSAWVAKKMGAPIGRIIIANNANRMLTELITSGRRESRSVVPTVAPAMDIQVPSNLERMRGESLAKHFGAGWASDRAIIETIRSVAGNSGYLLDPHTAAAWSVGSERRRLGVPQLVVSTADPAKFGEVVERAVGSEPALPRGFEDINSRPEHSMLIEAESSAVTALIR
jgi:threonine synthase